MSISVVWILEMNDSLKYVHSAEIVLQGKLWKEVPSLYRVILKLGSHTNVNSAHLIRINESTSQDGLEYAN